MDGDRDLLDAWRAGDRDAGSRLFDRHFDSLYRFFATKLSDGIEDAIQAVFLACVEGRDRFRNDASFRTFLLAIARNQLYARYRHQRRDAVLDFSVTSLVDCGPSPASVIVKHREHRLLLEALRSIPLDLQIAIELHYWEGLSGRELADALEIPEGTVRSRLRRGVEALQARIAELASSPELSRSTIENFEHWIATLHACLPTSASAGSNGAAI